MKYSEENIDIMLFDYLEGNLTRNEALEVEEHIASDPLIKEELNTWERSYVKPEKFPALTALESQLLQSPASFSFTLFLNSILLVCVTFIAGINPDIFSSPINQNKMLPPIEAKKPSSELVYQRSNINPVEVAKSKINISQQETEVINSETSAAITMPVSELDHISPSWDQHHEKLPDFISFKNTRKQGGATKKEIRRRAKKLRQMKRKSMRDQMALEFIKGDIPYVVPVDPKNF